MIEKQIITWLLSQRILCTKVDSTGIYDSKIKAFRRPVGNYKRLGVSDIIGIYKGKFLSIEVKSAKGKLSDHQKEWLQDVSLNGGISIVARSVEDVINALNSYDTMQITHY